MYKLSPEMKKIQNGLKKFVREDIYSINLLTRDEAKWLLELLEEENRRQTVLLESIIIQENNFANYDGDNVISSFFRFDNTAMEIMANREGNCHLFIIINVARNRIRDKEEQKNSTMFHCRSYRDCFKNRVKHEIGHYRHIKMGDYILNKDFSDLTPVSEYAKTNVYEAFAEAYSIDCVSLDY